MVDRKKFNYRKED